MASGQVQAKSLEWIHWGVLEYGRIPLKNSGPKGKTLTIDKDGNPKATDDFGDISPGRNALEVGKTPYFLKISKIREIIYISEGVCSLKSYRLWRISLYKEGHAEAPIGGGGPTRLLTLEELESVGQFVRNNVFGTSIRQKNPSGEQLGRSSLHLGWQSNSYQSRMSLATLRLLGVAFSQGTQTHRQTSESRE